ncbi:MAG: YciI family protein [Chloroflexota bacterium]
MANFVLVYHGGGMPESQEEGAKVMQAWTAWFAKLGDAVVDGGNPASKTRRIGTDGTVSDDAAGPSGYSIIKADSLDAAVELAKGCPVLAGGASVQVVETFNAM